MSKSAQNSMFEVDAKGLAKIAARRGKNFILFDLLQNAWDTDATQVNIHLERLQSGLSVLRVEDNDPVGFNNLSHAWTLFAESEKKGDVTKRGRFNLGEKLALSMCEEAKISTMKGGVHFDRKKGRSLLRKKRLVDGTEVLMTLKLTTEEHNSMLDVSGLLIPPSNIATFYNGRRIVDRVPLGSEVGKLMTEISNAEGYLERRRRATSVTFHTLNPGEVGWLYELGIPVCETGDAWHANIRQKVPLNLERDGVSTAYLKEVRAMMLNIMASYIETPEQAAAPWVRDAFSSDNVTKEAAGKIMDLRFSKERVITDLSDREGEDIAKSRGYTIITGGSMSKDEWATVKRFELVKPAGQVTPSPKPFTPGGKPLKMFEGELTGEMDRAQEMAEQLFGKLLGFPIRGCEDGLAVRRVDDRGWQFNGCYSSERKTLTINWALMKVTILAAMRGESALYLRFLIHEFAHHVADNHLSEAFHEACCQLGGRLAMLVARDPSLISVSLGDQ